MFDLVAVYTRKNPAHAWRFEAVKPKASAELDAGVNQNFGTSTRLIDVRVFCPKFLDDSTSSTTVTTKPVRPGR